MALDEVIKVRMSTAERNTLETEATAHNMKLSAWIRHKLLVVPQFVPQSSDTKAAVVQSVATKRIDTPEQAKEAIQVITGKPYHREPRGGYGSLLRK